MSFTTITFAHTTVSTVAAAFGWVQDGPAFHTINNETVYSDKKYCFEYTPGAFDEETGAYVGSFGDTELGAKFHAERDANGLNKTLLNHFGDGKTLGEEIMVVQYRKADKYGNDQFVFVGYSDQDNEINFWAHADGGERNDEGRIPVLCSSKSIATHGEYLQGIGLNQRWMLGSLVDQLANI